MSDLLKAAYTQVWAAINDPSKKLPHGYQLNIGMYSGGEWVEIYQRDTKE